MWHLARSAPLAFGAGASVSGALVKASDRQALVPSLPFSAAEVSGHNPSISFGLIFVRKDLPEKERETRTDFLAAFCKSSLSLSIYHTSGPHLVFLLVQSLVPGSAGTLLCAHPSLPLHTFGPALFHIFLCADLCRSRSLHFLCVASVGDKGSFWLLQVVLNISGDAERC